ncbi:oxidoreductase [Metabacillus sp. GX 13764]|uniref:oxidoreductase n=1 Tax=Metabacillus kandeliae TaxID=2900151 RepID=UPI001E5D3396|nr:oxidoreductase [Metabacillus kandeliae]MCD7036106.1 oxidoreductase [Metabacillus kandeliae]
MESIRAGLVGYGMSGQTFHAPFLFSSDKIQLEKVVERHSRKAEERYPEVKTVKSLDELLADESIQLVVITTPNEQHEPMIRNSLEAGKHVVVEKPFTVTSKDGFELSALAKEKDLVLSVYHNRRWDGDFLTVKKLIESGALGDVVSYEAHFDRFRPDPKRNAWREQDRPGSGILYDLGSHLIDQAAVLFGIPIAVTAESGNQRKVSEADDYFDIRFHYENMTAVLRASMLVKEQGPHFQIHGTKGSFIKYGMDPQENALKEGAIPGDKGFGEDPEHQWGTLNTDHGGLNMRGKVQTLKGNYTAFYEDICQAILEHRSPRVTAEQAAWTIRLIEAAKQSAEEGRKIEL